MVSHGKGIGLSADKLINDGFHGHHSMPNGPDRGGRPNPRRAGDGMQNPRTAGGSFGAAAQSDALPDQFALGGGASSAPGWSEEGMGE